MPKEGIESAGPRIQGVGIGIVAFGDTRRITPWDDSTWTFWTMNDAYAHFAQKASAVFEMHPASHYTDPKHFVADHEARLGAMANQVFLAFPNPKIPNAVVYPLKQVEAFFGRSYFCSSIAYMIPLAILKILASREAEDGLYLPRIGVWGCDMQLTSDWAKERACVEYWLARAEGFGIELVVPDESPLLKGGYLYGYQAREVSARQRVILARRAELTDMLAQALAEDRKANDRVSSLQAMLEESSFYEANLTEGEVNLITYK